MTKLSLLLKVLEGETSETLLEQMQLIHERALPDLGNNVKCGNSLIGSDFYDDQMTFPNQEQRWRINAFDWDKEFRSVFDDGKFDVVIGNPPYRRELDYKEMMDDIAGTEFGKRFRAPRMDLWYYFVHRGLSVLRDSGTLSFIVNAYWISGTGAKNLIAALRDSAHLEEVFFLDKLQVFRRVSGQHMIFRLANNQKNSGTIVKLVEPNGEKTAAPFVLGRSQVRVFEKAPEQLFRGDKIDLQPPADQFLLKLSEWPRLDSLGKVRQGIAENPADINQKTNKKFGYRWTSGEGVFALRPDEVDGLNLDAKEKRLLRPYFDLEDVDRYWIAKRPSRQLIYSTKETCPSIDQYPNLKQHLERFRPIMELRRETENGSNRWWHLHWPRDENLWKSPKIMSIQMAARPSFVTAFEPVYVPFSINVFVPALDVREQLSYLLGLLNSRLMWAWYRHHAKRRGVGLEINGNVLAATPIRTIDFSVAQEVKAHDRIVALVGASLDLSQQLREAGGGHEVTSLERELSSVDGKIDEVVYRLYGVTDDQPVVEAVTKELSGS